MKDRAVKYLKILEIVFPSMMFAFLLPVFYMTSDGRADSFMLPLYLAGFVLILPTAIGKYALWKVKGLAAWLIVCLAAVAAAYGAAYLVGYLLPWDVVRRFAEAAKLADEEANVYSVSSRVYVIVTTIEAVIILFDFYLVRMHEASRVRASRDNDLSWTERSFLFDTLTYFPCIWFAAVYLLGLLFSCAAVSDIAAVCFIIYGLMLLYYNHVVYNRSYLKRLDYISNMPGKRIRQIGIAMLALFLLLAAVLVSFSGVLTKNLRNYGDLRHWEGTGVIKEEDFAGLTENDMPGQMFVPPDEIQVTEEWKYSWIFEYISYAILALCAVIGVKFIFKFLNGIAVEFGDIGDGEGEEEVLLENGDLATHLKETRTRRTADSPRERIRREYRRAIRRARKGVPGVSETPEEIEEGAGLRGDPAMEDLHVRYEEARYGAYE